MGIHLFGSSTALTWDENSLFSSSFIFLDRDCSVWIPATFRLHEELGGWINYFKNRDTHSPFPSSTYYRYGRTAQDTNAGMVNSLEEENHHINNRIPFSPLKWHRPFTPDNYEATRYPVPTNK